MLESMLKILLSLPSDSEKRNLNHMGKPINGNVEFYINGVLDRSFQDMYPDKPGISTFVVTNIISP